MTYQPIVAFADAKIIGFEALIRWNHPERGFTGPGEFIALAEETGLIIPIGWWVIDQALRAVSLWNQNRSEEEALTVSVNLSPRQFMQPNLVDHIVFLVDQSNARPQNLILEITENVLMDDSANVADDIQRLRDFGIRLDLDDFGTGYSSLSFLRRFPLDMIKIDQTFIRDLENGGPSREIVKAMLMLAKGLGLRVTAEGVETQQQFEALQKMDCDCGQGYFFEKPLPLAETLELIAREDSVSSDRKQ